MSMPYFSLMNGCNCEGITSFPISFRARRTASILLIPFACFAIVSAPVLSPLGDTIIQSTSPLHFDNSWEAAASRPRDDRALLFHPNGVSPPNAAPRPAWLLGRVLHGREVG